MLFWNAVIFFVILGVAGIGYALCESERADAFFERMKRRVGRIAEKVLTVVLYPIEIAYSMFVER